jgi:hypothetical protein
MALYAFDGTGQKDDNPELQNTGDTNVAWTAESPKLDRISPYSAVILVNCLKAAFSREARGAIY